MQDIFGQVHWRTLQNFNDKKAPESFDAGAFCLADYSAAGSATASATGAVCIAAICS
jgi:hypothetical protein